MTELVLEVRDQQNRTPIAGPLMLTPPIDDDYWSYRVRLSDTQAVLGFPKFFTIGIGFAEEEDWNTNLPYTCETEEIFRHIEHNKGDESIADDDVLAAIRMIQDRARADRDEATARWQRRPWRRKYQAYSDATRLLSDLGVPDHAMYTNRLEWTAELAGWLLDGESPKEFADAVRAEQAAGDES